MAQTPTIARGGNSSAPARGPRNRAARTRRLSPRAIPYLLLVPCLLVIAALLLYPLVQMLQMSFQEVGLRQFRARNPLPAEFVGVDNFRQVLESELFWTSLRNTVLFALVAVTMTLVFGTLVGLLMHKLGPKMSIFVVVGTMAAWAVPPTAQAIIWKWQFDADAGIVNWALNLLPDWLSQAVFGRADWTGQPWLNDTLSIYFVLVVAVVWASFPFIAVSVLAGLKSIPSELYEAARVDGAGAVRTFWKITFPLLRPVFAVLVVLSMIWDFKVFTQLFLLAGGTNMPRDAFNLSVWSYVEAFNPPADMGLGAAIAIVLTVILLLITSVYVRQIVKSEDVR
ncbi:sugar ABC transporter permease [Microtetraspora sp. NBRC 13810]|uniref:carbohydrate ABC transporter permease n=1 Tax=Microtetraspora sp. NBRC 13810 TaxID=3030990 RepID=UPI0024A5466B|nr:sugar ABC transporter permease [Microtetraspora sp. NBRC 13810]GLW08529.1 sugar ABC transporter permease [Microtetraspora sp. NBRC 13810]